MARQSSIDAHPNRDAIARALVSGMPIRDVASRYAVSRSALARFKKTIPLALAQAHDARVTAKLSLGMDLLEHASDLQRATLDLFNAAIERGDETAAAAWFDRALRAGTFRLSVEAVRKDAPPATPITDALMRQGKLAETGERLMAALLKVRREREDREGKTIEGVANTPNVPEA